MDAAGAKLPGVLPRIGDPPRPPGLAHLNPLDLALELLYRLREGPPAGSALGETEVSIGLLLLRQLNAVLDIHGNRTSRRRYWDLFATYHPPLRPEPPPVRGATYVDLGCGSANPFALLFIFLALGARRGIAVDYDSIEDRGTAVKLLADAAAMLLVDPPGIVGDFAITREEMLANLKGFDLSRMRAGDPGGIDGARLEHRAESIHQLSLADGEADVVLSNAFLEHIDRVDVALEELRRVTKPGGYGIHVLDANDHRTYGNASIHPLEFLKDRSGREIVEGTNRLRPTTFAKRFEAHGFEVVDFFVSRSITVDDALRKSLAEPFRSMSNDELGMTMARISVRKRR
jgi:SAM-dependent methyltransferase